MKQEDDVVVVGPDKKLPPKLVYMRWSKVLNKWVPCDSSDRDAVTYQLLKE